MILLTPHRRRGKPCQSPLLHHGVRDKRDQTMNSNSAAFTLGSSGTAKREEQRRARAAKRQVSIMQFHYPDFTQIWGFGSAAALEHSSSTTTQEGTKGWDHSPLGEILFPPLSRFDPQVDERVQLRWGMTTLLSQFEPQVEVKDTLHFDARASLFSLPCNEWNTLVGGDGDMNLCA